LTANTIIAKKNLAGVGEDAKELVKELKESSFARKLTEKWKGF
jgi:hypothetical protein